jgi:uncharacterized membrane protein
VTPGTNDPMAMTATVLLAGQQRRLLRAAIVGGLGPQARADQLPEQQQDIRPDRGSTPWDELRAAGKDRNPARLGCQGGSVTERGPVQIVVVGFAGDEFAGRILPELRRLRSGELIRLLDAIFVSKDEDGCLTTVDVLDAGGGEWPEFGEILGALIGFDSHCEGLKVGADAGTADCAYGLDAGEAWAISDAIPADACAVVALIEHLWAIPLRGAVTRGGGFALEDTWLHRANLVAVGALTSNGIA